MPSSTIFLYSYAYPAIYRRLNLISQNQTVRTDKFRSLVLISPIQATQNASGIVSILSDSRSKSIKFHLNYFQYKSKSRGAEEFPLIPISRVLFSMSKLLIKEEAESIL